MTAVMIILGETVDKQNPWKSVQKMMNNPTAFTAKFRDIEYGSIDAGNVKKGTLFIRSRFVLVLNLF